MSKHSLDELLFVPSATSVSRRQVLVTLAYIVTLSACGGGSGGANPPSTDTPGVNGPAWWGFGRDAQHTAQGAVAVQPLSRIQ